MYVPIMPPRCHAALELPDGRRLAWHEWGAKSGTVVLFCTGAAMSGRLGFGPAAVERLDLRLIGVDRPGLAASDPHPEKTPRACRGARADSSRMRAGSLLWTRADDILDALTAHLASTSSSVPTTSVTSTVSSDFARQRS